MKKIIMTPCSLVIIIVCALIIAGAEKSGNYTYDEINGNVRITSFNKKYSGKVNIPQKINKYPVIAIDSEAFEGCNGITEITVPDTVYDIEYEAFANCKKLKKVVLSKGLEIIGYSAFHNCTALSSVTLPEGIIKICGNAFQNTPFIKSSKYKTGIFFIYGNYLLDVTNKATAKATIPSSVKLIADGAFEGCDKIKQIIIPKSITKIPEDCFNGCTELNKITIPKSVKEIGANAFTHCASLTSVTIPSGCTDIGYSAFSECTELNNVVIPDSITHLQSIFDFCTNLTNVTIPASVMEIDEGCFEYSGIYNNKSNWKNGVLYYGNYLLQIKAPVSGTLKIKDKTVLIADCAFADCKNLTAVTLPKSLKYIGERAFYSCTKLNKITANCDLYRVGREAFTNTGYIENKKNISQYGIYIGNCLIRAKSPKNGVFKIKSGTVAICENAFDEKASEWKKNGSYYSHVTHYTDIKDITIPASVITYREMLYPEYFYLKHIRILSKDCDTDFLYKLNKNAVIHAYKNSTAHKYALKHGYKFEEIKK